MTIEIPMSGPDITSAEIEAVGKVLRTRYLSLGPRIVAFEERFAAYVADNPEKDFLAPRHLGMSSIRIRHSGGLYNALEPSSPMYAPDVTITSLKDLEEAIATLEVALQ